MAEIDMLRREIKKTYRKLGRWELVGARFGINRGMAWRIANEPGYEPKEAHIRVRLGLPAMALAPVCGRCGEVHVRKRCDVPAKAGATRRSAKARMMLWEWPVDLLRRALEERKEF